MKKPALFSLFFVCFSFLSFSQDYFKNGYGEKRHSIGVFASPAEFVVWNRMPYDEEWSGGPKRLYVTPFYPIGINYQFQLNYFLKLNCSAYPSREHFLYNEATGGSPAYNIYIDYTVTYLKVPIGVRIYPGHISNEDAIGGFFFQASGSFDFVSSENIYKTTSNFIDPRSNKPPGGWPIQPVTVEETHSNQVRFHKFCPSVFIGHEIVLENMSFFYGGRLEMQAIYQNRNIQEYYKNRNFSVINIGASYRF